MPMVAESPKQEVQIRGGVAALMAYRGPELIIEGPRGTGKTQGILRWLHTLCLTYKGARILLCRSSRARLTESACVTFEEEVLGPGHPLLAGGASRDNRHSYDYPGTGASIVLGGLDDATRLLSTPWDIVYVNEVTEIPESLWEEFGGSLRWNHIPWQQRIGDCNPTTPAHWVNKRCDPFPNSLRISVGDPVKMRDVLTREKYMKVQAYNADPPVGKCKRIVTFHADNPAYWDVERWDWTQAGINYAGDQLAKMSGHRRIRFFEGRWKAASGTVYANFDDERHVITPFEVPDDWPIWFGYDAGVDHPSAVLWFTLSPPGQMYPKGRLYVIGEHVMSGLGVSRNKNGEEGHADIVRRIEADNHWYPRARYADPQHVFNSTAQSLTTLAQQWEEEGFMGMTPWPRAQNSAAQEAQVEVVRKRLNEDSLVVFNTCPHTIMEFQSWSYKRTASGELPPGDDKFEDRNDHCMDVVRGVVATDPTFDQLGCHVELAEGQEQAYDPQYDEFGERPRMIRVAGVWRRMRLRDQGME